MQQYYAFCSLSKSLCYSLIALLAFSCSQKPAPIVHRGHELYDKNNRIILKKYGLLKEEKKRETNYSLKDSEEEIAKKDSKEIKIAAGDSLYGIAKKHRVTIKDLINQNDLKPPYLLKIGSSLEIPISDYHLVKEGDTLYGISRTYGMKIEDLIKINNLKEPYGIKVNEKIRISNAIKTSKTKEKSQTKKAENKIASKSSYTKLKSKNNRFVWPLRGEIISTFGPKNGGLHNDGINIRSNEGDIVKASEDGIVAYVGNELKGYGNLIIIKHSGGWITAYAHLRATNVVRGQKINKGESIALTGSTGNVTSPQLYFGLRKGRDAVNPLSYLTTK